MITIDSLTKRYGDFTALDDISFTARDHRVTGFLGANGAGKSTTMRVLVGLTPPTAGTATISGRRFADLPNPALEVGVLLDASAQHAGRTGREILTITQRTLGAPARRVGEMLDLVSLTGKEADRRVGAYSLGMRQRLGIAAALLGDPQVLILDEPANGLDPPGIRWIRDLMRAQAARGRTGREVLTIAQRTVGAPARRVDEMLDLVSLTGKEADRRVGAYSLGMRQRLGIATALIGEPEVLILDEPANGLDPAGIRWMRDLLRGHADQGGTVLLSSHLLHEIEIVADEGGRDAEPLPHAERVGADPALRLGRREADELEQLVDPAGRRADRALRDREDLAAGAAGVLGGGVEEDAHLEGRVGQVREPVPGDGGAARRRRREADQDAHGRRLAGAVRAEETGHATTARREADVVEGGEAPVPLRE